MKKINKTLIKGLALTLGACSLVPLAACGNETDNKTQIWNARSAYVTAQEQGFVGTFEEFLQAMSNIQNIIVNSKGELVFTLGDGTQFNAGIVKGSDGKDGAKGETGKGIASVTSEHDDAKKVTVIKITFTDGTYTTVDIPDGEKGEKGENGNDGQDGQNGEKGEKGDNGDDAVGFAKIEKSLDSDRWHIVDKKIITLTNDSQLVLDNSLGIIYGRPYDANSYEELSYLVSKGVTNIVLTNDIVVGDGTGEFKLTSNEQDTYYSIDLNNHTIYGSLRFQSCDTNKNETGKKIYADVSNGKIVNTAATSHAFILYGGNLAISLNNVTASGYEAGISTNGVFKGGQLIAYNCTFTGSGNPYGQSGKAADASVGAYLPGGFDYDFTGCTFTGEMGICAKSGNIEFRDCTINGISTYSDPVYNGNGSSGTGSAFVVASTTGYHEPMQVSIYQSRLNSIYGYAIEEVALAKIAGTEKCYATIYVDKETTLSSPKDVAYRSLNDVITFENKTSNSDETTVTVNARPTDDEIKSYIEEGKTVIVIKGDSEYKIGLVNNIQDTKIEVDEIISYADETKETLMSTYVAYNETKLGELITAEKTSIFCFFSLNKIPASLVENTNYYIQEKDSYVFLTKITEEEVTEEDSFISSDSIGQILVYKNISNNNATIILSDVEMKKQKINTENGYIISISWEDICSEISTVSADEIIVVKIVSVEGDSAFIKLSSDEM